MNIKRKLLIALLNRVGENRLSDAIERMWQEELLDRRALERLYINAEVDRRVRAGESKTKAIEQLSRELGCSYEKARGAVYYKKEKKKNGNTD
jgi:hypothetical protein